MESSNTLVSIIVPIYNAEKYLCRCVESLINLTHKNIEILLVDDGSKDASGTICDEYAKKDCRVKVFHKKNGGVATARQLGLDNARGEYVIHADPDDWVEPNWITDLLKIALEKQYDIIMCDFIREDGTKSEIISHKPTSLKKEDLLADLLENRIWGSMCDKLIYKNCFKKYNVSFIPQMNLLEDLYVTCELIYKGASLYYVPAPLYHYDCYSNENSLVRKPNINQIQSVSIFIKKFETLLKDDRYQEAFFKRKMGLKTICFRTGIENCTTLISLFDEINPRIISENKFHLKDIRALRGDIYRMERICIAQCLKGRIRWGYFLYFFWKNVAIISLRNLFFLKK